MTARAAITVETQESKWRIRGDRVQVEFDPTDLRLRITAPSGVWQTEPSRAGDLVVRQGEAKPALRLADAGRKEVERYATGFSTGLKCRLTEFAHASAKFDLDVQLFITLEPPDEDLIVRMLATDNATRVQECAWPPSFTGDSFDAVAVPFMQGMLLPTSWPQKVWLYDSVTFGRGLYMPWWGFLRGEAGALCVLETPFDGGCRFEHPGAGTTRLGPRWLHSQGRFSYPRQLRFAFTDAGGYVRLAKRYRNLEQQSGNFVTLREKVARNAKVARMIGSPVVHTSILYHIQPESSYYSKDDPAKNHQLVTFAERGKHLAKLADRGIRQAYVHLDGWGLRGYDNLHPDVLPPNPEAGGWEGMKQFAQICQSLGFLFAIHDQYRDYYLDAASYEPRHTLLEENGKRPEHSTWYGGKQSVLCPSLAPGHVRKNHLGLLTNGVQLDGAYLDVFAVVPPEECYNPEHPVTRAQCLADRGQCLDWVRAWGGVVSSEEPSGWAIPHLDLVHHGPYPLDPNPGKGPAFGIPIPLFNLVYHECLLTPWSMDRGAWGIPEKDLGFLHGLGNGGLPYLSLDPSAEELERVRTMCELHKRLWATEMTGHAFLDDERRRQLFTYADGTKVTIDLAADRFEINPPLPGDK